MLRNFFPAAHPNQAEVRMLWLPGAYDAAQDFKHAGFEAAVARRGLALDLEFIDLELRYLGDDRPLQELRDSVILPLREAGIAVWLGGISLGGLLALDYAACHSGELAGLCLLAPYLGNRMLIREIVQAPGLQQWQPGKLAEFDAERRIWRYIKNRRTEAAPLYLGFGREDRFSPALQLLAGILPPKSVDIVAGGHDWLTWARLWENFLDSGFA